MMLAHILTKNERYEETIVKRIVFIAFIDQINLSRDDRTTLRAGINNEVGPKKKLEYACVMT